MRKSKEVLIAIIIVILMIVCHILLLKGRDVIQSDANDTNTLTVLTVGVLTSPRKNNDIQLITTIHSLIDQFKHFIGYYKFSSYHERVELIRSMMDRYQLHIVVANHFGDEHTQFLALKQVFEDFVVEAERTGGGSNPLSHLIQLHLIDANAPDGEILGEVLLLQRVHASSLLKHSLRMHNQKISEISSHRKYLNEYIMLLEDDFPVCTNHELSFPVSATQGDQNGLSRLYNALDRISDKVRNGHPFCGVFVATGGSGLVFSPATVKYIISVLDQSEIELTLRQQNREVTMPHDIIMQRCLSGGRESQTEVEKTVFDKFCSECKPQGSLFVSDRLWFKHIGHYSSSIFNREYHAGKWGCGTRQPFASRSFVSQI